MGRRRGGGGGPRHSSQLTLTGRRIRRRHRPTSRLPRAGVDLPGPRRVPREPGGPAPPSAQRPRPAGAGRLAAAGGARGPGGAVAAAGAGGHRVPGRGHVPVGGPPAVGALAARHPGAAVLQLLLRGTGRLPAAGSPGGQHRRARRGPDPVPCLHARGDRAGVGRHEPAYGRRAAFFAAALFAVAGPTLHLGAFATYDALSVLLLAVAAWCVIRAGDQGEGTGWMVAAGAALAVANAAAYSSALFDPVVVVLAALTACAGARLTARRCSALLITAAVLVGGGLLIGGSGYLTGIKQTTLARVGGSDSRAVGALRRLGMDRASAGPGRARRHHQRGRPGRGRADLAARGPGRRRPAQPARPGAPEHRCLAEQARGPGGLVRRHRRGLRGGQGDRGRTGGPGAGRYLRGLRARAGLSHLPGRRAVPDVLHRLAQRVQLHRDIPPAGRSRQRPPAGRRRRDRPRTTCPPAASGSAGPPPGTSSCPPAAAPAARPPAPA